MIKPTAGFAIESLSVWVILGTRNPWVVEANSNRALGLGFTVLIPTLLPLSKICEFPPVLAEVNFITLLSVPETLADPGAPVAPVAPC